MPIKVKNLTEGNLLKIVFNYSIPFVGIHLLHSVYSLTDIYIVGNYMSGFSSTIAMSAIATGSTAIALFVIFILGLTTGASIIIAQNFGAKEVDKLDNIVGSCMSVFSIIGFLCALIIFIFAPFICTWLQAPPTAYEATLSYVRICSIGLIFITLSNMIGAVLRGLGNSVTPLLFLSISIGLNIPLDILAITVFNAGISGVAWATVISQLIGLAFSLIYLRKKEFLFMFRLQDFRFNKSSIKQLFKLGIPISMQNLFVMLSLLLIMALVNKMGVSSSAAYGIMIKLFEFTAIPAFGFGMALSAITAQNMGAKRITRAKSALWISSIYATLFCGTFFLIQICFPEFIMHIFTSEENIVKSGVLFLRTNSYMLLTFPILICLIEFINSVGKTGFVMIVDIITTLFIRVFLAFLLTRPASATLYDVGFTFVLTNIVETIIMLVYYQSEYWLKPSRHRPKNKNYSA